MTKQPRQPQIVVVYSDGVSCPDADTVARLRETGLLSAHSGRPENVSGQKPCGFPYAAHAAILGRGDSSAAYDPHSVHRAFPDRWRAYIRANFRDLNHVQQVFAVSERTARKWWKGETGANGGHVAIAVNEHPVAAPRMLFAAE